MKFRQLWSQCAKYTNQVMAEEKRYLSEQPLLPIHMIKILAVPKEKGKNTKQYFAISTIDQVFFIYSYSESKAFKLEFETRLLSPACEIFFDKLTSNAFLGLFSGDIIVLHLQQDKFRQKLQQQFKSDQQKGEQDCHIQIIYTKTQKLYAWRGSYEVLLINKNTMELKEKYKFAFPLTAGISFLSPNNYNNIGCITFFNSKPPMIFDCDDVEQFKKTQQKCSRLYEEREVEESQVLKMAFQKQLGINYLVCGCKDQHKGIISIYTIKEHEELQIEYCQRLYKFCIQNNITIEHIHINDGIAVITFWDKFMIFTIQSRKRKGKNRNLGKKLSWGFILKTQSKGMTLIFSRGFNHVHPQIWEKKRICFHEIYQQYKL